MLFNLWRLIQLWLPYGFILWLYRKNKAIPANIKTREGNNFKAILITENYGILYSDDVYIKNRGAYLMQQRQIIQNKSNEIITELNSLNMHERERLYRDR